MKNLHNICCNTDIKAQELYSIIKADNELNREVLRISHKISNDVKSLVNAFIILGVNTIKNIVLTLSDNSTVKI